MKHDLSNKTISIKFIKHYEDFSVNKIIMKEGSYIEYFGEEVIINNAETGRINIIQKNKIVKVIIDNTIKD